MKSILSIALFLGVWLGGLWQGQAYQASVKYTGAARRNVGYKVIGVKDGDTFVVLAAGKPLVVRFAHIDCPEKKQPFGSRAKQFVADKCFGKYVSLAHNNQYDRNKRLVAEVVLPNGTNLNKDLVRNGLAWHFKKYSTDTGYARLEALARKEKTGIWSEANPVAPWDWRKQRRKNIPVY
ncbi:MAG: thermonuclease family protein [Edaphocola sp.]